MATDNYLKLCSAVETSKGGDLFFFDSQCPTSRDEALRQAVARQRKLTRERRSSRLSVYRRCAGLMHVAEVGQWVGPLDYDPCDEEGT